jgi:hypothetical protein
MINVNNEFFLFNHVIGRILFLNHDTIIGVTIQDFTILTVAIEGYREEQTKS